MFDSNNFNVSCEKHSEPSFGAFTEPHDETAPVLNLRELIRYCDEKKVEPHELSTEELKKFEVSPKKK